MKLISLYDLPKYLGKEVDITVIGKSIFADSGSIFYWDEITFKSVVLINFDQTTQEVYFRLPNGAERKTNPIKVEYYEEHKG